MADSLTHSATHAPSGENIEVTTASRQLRRQSTRPARAKDTAENNAVTPFKNRAIGWTLLTRSNPAMPRIGTAANATPTPSIPERTEAENIAAQRIVATIGQSSPSRGKRSLTTAYIVRLTADQK